jgi:hypothetical protein
MSPPSSGFTSNLHHSGFLFGLFFDPKEMEARCCSKTLTDFQQATRHYIPEDRILHDHCHENLKSYIKNKGETTAEASELINNGKRNR